MSAIAVKVADARNAVAEAVRISQGSREPADGARDLLLCFDGTGGFTTVEVPDARGEEKFEAVRSARGLVRLPVVLEIICSALTVPMESRRAHR